MPNLVIRDARIVLPEGVIRGELSVEGEKIRRVALTGIPKGDVEIRARGRLAIPGAVDGHACFYNRRRVYGENFKSGSIAATAGGVTTVAVSLLDDSIKTLRKAEELIRAGERSSAIDFMVHAGHITPGFIKNLVKLASIGIRSFKVTNCHPSPCSYDGIKKLMELVVRLNSLVVAYPEDTSTLREMRKKLIKEGKRDVFASLQGHPPEAEGKGISKIGEIALQTGSSIHFAPVTAEEGLKAIGELKRKRAKVTAETCPHHLIFQVEDLEKLKLEMKVSPPIRGSEHVAALWQGIEDGTIDIITSGHVPTLRTEKELEKPTTCESSSCTPSVETLVPLVFTEGVEKSRITVEKFVDLISSEPAKILGLFPQKGVIREGSDADIVLLDTREEVKIKAEKLHSTVEWTPYEGMRVKGIPAMTISRGEIVMENGVVDYRERRGRFLRRESRS